MSSPASQQVDLNANFAMALPVELKDLVVDELPGNLRDRLHSGPLRRRIQEAPFSPLTKAFVPPTGDERPFLDLPPETRRQIFRYILPEKRFSIEPTYFAESRKDARKKHMQEIKRLQSERVARQQQQQQQITGLAQFNINGLFMTNGTNIPVAHQPQVPLPGPAHWANPNPNLVLGVGGQTHVFNPATAPFVPTPQNPPPQFQHVFQLNNIMPNFQPATPQLITLIAPLADSTDASGSKDVVNLDRDMEYQRALRTADLDPSAENMVRNLMLVNQKLCLEVAEIMYEEYTFEIHIHAQGVDFLHLPRIPAIQEEEYGPTIESELAAFQRHRQFCFQRMKHIEFVMWGGDPKKRTDGLHMRQTVRKLVDMLLREKEPVVEIKARFELAEPVVTNKNTESDHFYDELGTFWKNNIEKRARLSIFNNITNVELVCAPLESLRGVNKVRLTLPAGVRDDHGLVNYKRIFEYTLTTKSRISADKYDKIKLQEQTTMEAAIDYDMKNGQYHLDGYYAPHPLLKQREDFNLRIDECIEGLVDGSTEVRMREAGPAPRDDVSYEMDPSLSRYASDARNQLVGTMFDTEALELDDYKVSTESAFGDSEVPDVQSIFSYNRRTEEEENLAVMFAAYEKDLEEMEVEQEANLVTSKSFSTNSLQDVDFSQPTPQTTISEVRFTIPNTGRPQRGEPSRRQPHFRIPDKILNARDEDRYEDMEDLL
jgi:hypothetical protein